MHILPRPRPSASILRPWQRIAAPRPHWALCFWDKLYLALGHWHSYARYDADDGVCRMA